MISRHGIDSRCCSKLTHTRTDFVISQCTHFDDATTNYLDLFKMMAALITPTKRFCVLKQQHMNACMQNKEIQFESHEICCKTFGIQFTSLHLKLTCLRS